MRIRIHSREKLNANAYNRIIIRGVNGDCFVRVDGEKPNDEYVSLPYKLSDRFKKCSSNERIIVIVDSFLEGTEISKIELSVPCVGCSGKFIKVSGTREMYLQSDDVQLVEDVIKMIESKYDRDRNKYCINNEINNSYNIYLNSKQSSYGRECIECEKCDGCDVMDNICPNVVQLKLMYVDGEIVSFDKQFIQRFIYDKLYEFGEKAYIFEEKEDIKVGGVTKIGESCKAVCISCGELLIRFACSTFTEYYIYDFCDEIVSKYNNERIKNDQIKKRQLKMEGF